MPRVDNKDMRIRRHFPEVYVLFPGEGLDERPADFCFNCYAFVWFDLDEVEHPPYEMQDPPSRCLGCGKELADDDN